jgi:hypothetical protein
MASAIAEPDIRHRRLTADTDMGNAGRVLAIAGTDRVVAVRVSDGEVREQAAGSAETARAPALARTLDDPAPPR